MEVGTILSGRYQIVGTIGSGGMANVFLAQDLILERHVAVKVLKFDFQKNPDALRRFQREAISTSQLLHRNIVEVYDVEESDGQQYIVMEYVKGTDLKTYIRQNAPISLELVVDIMCQILSAIDAAHRSQIIHRDIKPQNILITESNQVKITDFGIAIALSDTSITQTNTLLGSVHYMSPEQAKGGGASMKSDIYALGIVLYELITGRLPYDGESPVSIALKHFQEPFPRIKDQLEYVPQSLENVVLKATAKNPDNRYASAESMEADLTTSLHGMRMKELPFEETDRPVIPASAIQPVVVKPKKPIEPVEPLDIDEYPIYDELQPVTPKKRNLKWLKWFVLFGLVTTIASGAYYIYMQTVRVTTVPSIHKLSQSDAESLLIQSDLTVGEIQYQWDDTLPSGTIISSDPASGDKVNKNTSVNLVISNGKEQVELADYTGMDYETIRSQLSSLNFIVVRKGFAVSSPDQVGKILAQSIAEGSKVIPGETTLAFTVGTDSQGSRMPDFYNLPLQMVQDFADEYGIFVEVTEAHDEYVPAGRIIEQEEVAGIELVKGDTIHVTVSQGAQEVKESAVVIDVHVDYLPVYAPSDRNQTKPLPNTVQVFIGDNRNNIREVAKELTITQAKNFTITLYVLENSVGQYRVIRNGEIIAESNEVYPE